MSNSGESPGLFIPSLHVTLRGSSKRIWREMGNKAGALDLNARQALGIVSPAADKAAWAIKPDLYHAERGTALLNGFELPLAHLSRA